MALPRRLSAVNSPDTARHIQHINRLCCLFVVDVFVKLFAGKVDGIMSQCQTYLLCYFTSQIKSIQVRISKDTLAFYQNVCYFSIFEREI